MPTEETSARIQRRGRPLLRLRACFSLMCFLSAFSASSSHFRCARRTSWKYSSSSVDASDVEFAFAFTSSRPASHIVSCGRSALNELSASSAVDHLERPNAEKDLGIEMRTLGRGRHPPPDRVPPPRRDDVRRHGLRWPADRDFLQVLQLGELLRVVVDRRLLVAAYPAQTRPDQELDLVRVCATETSSSRPVRAFA